MGLINVLTTAPIPSNDPIAQPKRAEYGKRRDPQEGMITRPWQDFFTAQGASIAQGTTVAAAVSVPAAAAIGATDISTGLLPAGVYRLSYYVRITTVASVSSSVRVTLDWQDGGNAMSFTGATITGNTTATYQTDTLIIRIDSASPVRYSTNYASNAASEMQFLLDVVLEKIRA